MQAQPNYLWLFFKPTGRVGRRLYALAGLFVFTIQLFFAYRFVLEIEGIVPATDPSMPDEIILTPAGDTYLLLFTVALFIGSWCHIALTAKRFHDFNKPGALAALFLIGGYLMVLVLAFIKSDPGPNRYGSRSDSET